MQKIEEVRINSTLLVLQEWKSARFDVGQLGNENKCLINNFNNVEFEDGNQTYDMIAQWMA